MEWNDVYDPLDFWGTHESDRIKRANEALDTANEAMTNAAAQNASLYKQYMDKVQGNYGTQAGQYDQRVQDLENLNPYDAGQFGDNYTKTVDDFYSKYANQRKQQAMDAITNSNANAGNMFSSDYTNALAAKQQALASEEWDKAFQKYQQDRSQALNEFSTNANLGQQAYSNMYNKNKDLLGMSQNAMDNITNAFGSYTQGLAGNNAMLAQNAANLAQQKAANENSRKTLLGRVFG